MANHRNLGTRADLGDLLEALKICRACEGEAVMWSLVPRGVEFLARLLEEIEGLGPDYALEVALKVAMEVGWERELT